MLVIVQLINMTSVFVSFILAFLILYANKFMIRRRKKELGIYMTLGMPKGKISAVLLLETLIIGAFSLFAGLLIGVLLSQGLAVVTASMFAVQIKQFRMVFSMDACLKSLLYFGIIFLVVMLFNSFSISRRKLIDLLNAERKNEELKNQKSCGCRCCFFLVSVGVLAVAYERILRMGVDESGPGIRHHHRAGHPGHAAFFPLLPAFCCGWCRATGGFT